MNRYAFYFGIGLLSFFIGSIVVFFVYLKITDKTSEVQNIITLETSAKENTQVLKIDDDFPSDEKFLKWEMDSFKPILDKWLKNQRIKEVVELKRYDEYASPNTEARVTLIDVNKDGINELGIQSGCSATGNCSFWLFKKKGKSYETILTSVHDVNFFKLRKTSNKNHQDIEARMHGSWNAGDGVIYKFDGKEYKPEKCFGYIYEKYQDKNGKRKAKQKPTFEYYNCDF